MAEIPNRSDLEIELAQLLSKLSTKQHKQLIKLLGNPPLMTNVPEEFWQSIINDIGAVYTPFATRVYMDAANRMISAVPGGVDWAMVNDRAVNWARHHGADFIRQATTHTRQVVQNSVSSFFETPGMTIGQLGEMIMPAFSPVRSEMIAITEVTRAAVQAEIEIAEELAEEGILLDAIWQTNSDDLVCPICSPQDGVNASGYTGKRDPYWTTISGEIKPPAHPRCRCHITFEIPKPKGIRPQ